MTADTAAARTYPSHPPARIHSNYAQNRALKGRDDTGSFPHLRVTRKRNSELVATLIVTFDDEVIRRHINAASDVDRDFRIVLDGVDVAAFLVDQQVRHLLLDLNDDLRDASS